jgi:hypothetical protein
MLCGLTHAVGTAHAQDAASPKITHVAVNGSGCPTGTSQTKLDADGLGVAITFSELVAAVDADTRIDVKACSLGIEVADTDKHSYAVESITIAGQSEFAEGATGKLTLSSYVQSANDRSNFELPAETLANNFQLAVEIGAVTSDQLQWTECGAARNLNVLTYLSLSDDGSSAAKSFIDLTSNADNASSGMTVRVVSRPCS